MGSEEEILCLILYNNPMLMNTLGHCFYFI